MSVARAEPDNETDVIVSNWIARAKKLVDHNTLLDYGEIKLVDPAAIDALLRELVDDLHARNAEYETKPSKPWWNKVGTAKLPGIAHNLMDMVEVLWLMQGKCGAEMAPWLNFFMAQVQRSVIRCNLQNTVRPGGGRVYADRGRRLSLAPESPQEPPTPNPEDASPTAEPRTALENPA